MHIESIIQTARNKKREAQKLCLRNTFQFYCIFPILLMEQHKYKHLFMNRKQRKKRVHLFVIFLLNHMFYWRFFLARLLRKKNFLILWLCVCEMISFTNDTTGLLATLFYTIFDKFLNALSSARLAHLRFSWLYLCSGFLLFYGLLWCCQRSRMLFLVCIA